RDRRVRVHDARPAPLHRALRAVGDAVTDEERSAAVLRACRGLPLRTFAAGETVLAEGTRAGVLYVLATGSIEVAKGDVQINTLSDPGAFFGEMSLLLDTPHTATVRALAPSSFYVANDPLAFIRAHPDVALEVA